jgi:hypothetical protein
VKERKKIVCVCVVVSKIYIRKMKLLRFMCFAAINPPTFSPSRAHIIHAREREKRRLWLSCGELLNISMIVISQTIKIFNSSPRNSLKFLSRALKRGFFFELMTSQ